MTAVFTRFATLAAAAVAVGSLSTSARAQTGLPLPLRLTSFAVNMSNVGRGGASGTVDFTINRWSTDAERKTLLDAFQKGGGKSLLSALEVMHEGRFRHLPVVDGAGKVIGMLSVRDVLRDRLGELSLKNTDLVNFISTDGSGG